MTTITTRLRVDADGNVIVPVGVEEAGQEVLVSVSPTSAGPAPVSTERWQQVIRETFGTFDDPTFKRPDFGPASPIAPLDLE